MELYGRLILALVSFSLLLGCQDRRIEVSDPFYLDYIENPQATELRICGNGCAGIEGLPSADIDGSGPYVAAAGANRNFIAVEQKQIGHADEPSSYYYFARPPQEKLGWARQPPKIIGPLSEVQFSDAKLRLGLPELTVKP